MLAHVAPLPGVGEHGALDLESAVGRAGLVRACRVEPCRDPCMVDGVEPEPAEVWHQAIAHVDVMGPERGRFPPMFPPRAVAGGEVPKQRRLVLSRRRHVFAAPQAASTVAPSPARHVEREFRETSERILRMRPLTRV